ncbi:MAG: VOC family protein [Cyanobacteria bacterium J06621_11]
MKFKFVNTRVVVKDWQASRQFYRDVMGLTETFVSDIDMYAELTDGSVKLSLLAQEKLVSYYEKTSSFIFDCDSDKVILSFRVDDVEAACEYLVPKGARVVTTPSNLADIGVKVLLIRDPEGNLIELTQMGEMVYAE